jgi:hypothetical protein
VNKFFVLGGVDGAVRAPELIAGTGFYFHKDQYIAIPCDQVDFAVACTRAVVPGHNGIPAPSQKAMGQVFAPSPRRPAAIRSFPAQPVPHPVERPVKRC